MYYHASPIKGIKVLEPRISNHNIPLVYFSTKRENTFVYLSNAVEKLCKEKGFIYEGVWSKWGPYGFDSQGKYTQLPMEGFDGQVVITKSGQFSLQNRDVRINIVFHELEENYLRTDKKMNYRGGKGVGAHNTAADIEFQGWGACAGQAEYITYKAAIDIHAKRRADQYKATGQYLY